MAQLRDKRELLYLQKDASGVVSVPCTGLAQHQIDGVRFLFKQYRKLNPGVIINYPSGCGSSVQVGTFITAIYTQLDKPILILYDKEGEREAWIKMFSNWTDIPKDAIAVDSPSIFVRNLVHITNISEGIKLCGRKWNIIVVKTDEINKMLLKVPLVADFKIWITSVDLKKNRDMFNTLYTRIYGSMDVKLPKYLEKFKDKEKALLNSLFPNVLYEDCLWINRNLLPFATHKLPSKIESEIPTRVSKKNKDATGKKIKRSKKCQNASTSTICDIFDTQTDSAQDFNIENNTSRILNSGTDKNDDSDNKMDVESFIRDNEPLKRDYVFQTGLDQVNSKRDNVFQTSLDQVKPITDNVSHTSSVQVNPLTKVMDSDEFDTEQVNFSEAIDDIVRIENDNNVEIAEDLVEPEENESSVAEGTTKLVDSNVNKLDNLKVNKANDTVCKENGINAEIADELVEPEENDISVVIAEGVPTTVNDEINNLKVKANVKATTSIIKQTDIFDSKLKEVEERALKKFKGTFLDKMF